MRTINISGARCFRLQLLRFTLWDGASAPQARNGAGDLLEIIAKGADSRSRQQPGALKQYRRNRTAPSEPRSEYIMAGPARGSPRGRVAERRKLLSRLLARRGGGALARPASIARRTWHVPALLRRGIRLRHV